MNPVAAPKYTEQQRQAIQTRDVSVALSAGAGCGKTFVLTERYLAYFDPVDPQALQPSQLGHLVAITFTERAAREMRDRVRKKCHERLLAAPPEHAHYWADLLRGLDAARISTIHSFCSTLVRSRAVEAGVDPQFAVLEQAQADTLLSESIDDELRRLLARQDAVVLELGERFDLHGLRDMLRVLVLSCAADEFRHWSTVSPEEQVAHWQKFFQETVLPEVARQVVASPAAREVLAVLAEHVPGHQTMAARREVLLERLPTLGQSANSVRTLAAALEEIKEHAKVQGGGSAKHWDCEEAYHRFKEAATDLRDLVKDVSRVFAFDPTAALEAARVGQQLFSLAKSVHDAYEERKAELAVLDFSDLMTRARWLLTDPRHKALQQRLSAQIHLLLVDEFQDTDPLQVELVRALCGTELAAGKLFFVGDYKQSIYRFRGADPGVFRELREQTPAAGQQSLTLNFRSQPAILEFVNGLFWDDLGAGYEPLRPSRKQVSPRPAVEFLWAPSPEDTKEPRELQRRREADWIARRLRILLDSQTPIVWDQAAASAGTPQARAAQPGDIAILFRALSDVELYEDALRRYGIDYYLVGGHAFYAQQEIFDLLNLLRALNSPSDLVSLAGVLRSGFFSLSDETLFWLAHKGNGLATGLFAQELPGEIPAEQQARVRFAARTIEHLRGRKDRQRVSELIEEALALTGYDAMLLAEFLGERKLANLRKLVEQARGFTQGDFFGLSDFIAQLAEFVVRQPDEPLAATHSENTNVVRLMTIHQSKGLEFPIVVVPDMDRPRVNRADRVHFHPRLGPLVALPRDEDAPDVLGGYELWRMLERREDADETNRLLYVATTRAADYLILSSGVPKLGAASGPWLQLLAKRFDLLSGNFLASLPAGEPIPQVQVTTAEPEVARHSTTRRQRIDLEKLADAMAADDSASTLDRAVVALPPDLSARREYSFSRLSGRLHRPRVRRNDAEDPAAESGVDAKGLGTLVHAVMAAIPFGQRFDLAALVRLHATRHLDGDETQLGQALEMIERFLGSPRARELAAARQTYTEVEFLLAWPPDAPGAREQMLTGYIDRLYQDADGQWHVIDFKTSQLSGSSLDKVAAGYEMQMLVYGLATQQIFKAEPKSLMLHFLRTGQEHAFAWNAQARKRLVKLVNEGIAAATAPPVALAK